MHIILENLVFIIPSIFFLGSFLNRFNKNVRGTTILSRHKHQTINKVVYAGAVLLVLIFAYLEYSVLKINTYSTFFLIAYLGILLGVQGSPLLVTEKGFFVRGVFVTWEEISGVVDEKSSVLRIQRRVKGHFELKIKGLERQEVFVDLLNEKRSSAEAEKEHYEFSKKRNAE